MNKQRTFSLTFCASLLFFGPLATRVEADPRGTDMFSIWTSPPPAVRAPSSKPAENQSKPKVERRTLSPGAAPKTIIEWFEQFDQLREKYRPTAADRVILSRPLMQEEERVSQWTNTASKISKNYILLARTLKSMPVPSGLPELTQYRDLTADWYRDAADVFDEMIRPRDPAKTIEELERQLNEVQNKSHTLDGTIASLKDMDRDLRHRYKVNQNDKEDALQKYVKGK
jgi:hypothetical protein